MGYLARAKRSTSVIGRLADTTAILTQTIMRPMDGENTDTNSRRFKRRDNNCECECEPIINRFRHSQTNFQQKTKLNY